MSKSEAMTAGNCLGRLGAAASLACAAHCAAMPLLAGLAPLVGMGFLAPEQTEWLLVGLSLGIGGLSLPPSYARRRRQWRPLLLFAFGVVLIIAVRLADALPQPRPHQAGDSVGAAVEGEPVLRGRRRRRRRPIQ